MATLHLNGPREPRTQDCAWCPNAARAAYKPKGSGKSGKSIGTFFYACDDHTQFAEDVGKRVVYDVNLDPDKQT